MFLEISQNSQENPVPESFFLIKLQAFIYGWDHQPQKSKSIDVFNIKVLVLASSDDSP